MGNYEETGSRDSLDTILGRSTTACKYCGEEGLYWLQEDGRWKLVNEKNVLHTCEEYKEAKLAERNKEFKS